MVNIPKKIPDFTVNQDYNELVFKEFFESFSNKDKDKEKHMPFFLKSALFENLSTENRNERLETMISKLDVILENAQQNFEIYLNNLSLENLKKDYIEYKDNYFNQVRDVLGKIATQIIGLPIAISATALATYSIKEIPKIKDANLSEIIWVLIIAFIIYSIYAVVILRFYKSDLADIKFRFQNDFERLEKSPFFEKYKDEKKYFQDVKDRLKSKVNTVFLAIWTYLILLCLTNSYLISIFLREVSVEISWAILFFIILITLFAVDNIFYKKIREFV